MNLNENRETGRKRIDRIKEKFKIIRYKGDNNEMNKNLSFKIIFTF